MKDFPSKHQKQECVMKKFGFLSSMVALAATAFVLVGCGCWDRDPCCNPCPRPCPPKPCCKPVCPPRPCCQPPMDNCCY